MNTRLDLIGKRLLWLTLKKEAFEVMVTGEKIIEFRKKSKWIESRLFDKKGKVREYDFIVFTNGYGNDKPYFIAEMVAFKETKRVGSQIYSYSNGLTVEVEQGDYMILIGNVLKIGNYENRRNKNV